MNPIEANETAKDMQDMGQRKEEGVRGAEWVPYDMLIQEPEGSTHGKNLTGAILRVGRI